MGKPFCVCPVSMGCVPNLCERIGDKEKTGGQSFLLVERCHAENNFCLDGCLQHFVDQKFDDVYAAARSRNWVGLV